MIRLNDEFSLSYKNGYFQAHKHCARGSESKTPGETYESLFGTYPSVSSALYNLQNEGVSGSEIDQVCARLIKDEQQKVSKSFIRAKEKEVMKNENKHNL